ncbi:transcription elongation factor GreA [Clostridium sp. 19966]|uniref:transcription elongation factor GreA n=1 Tax=Clostridium sp. 19966 TaxID=2768166 RepID=UPI0028E08C5B|nr:transcription elongation factor GreA [Clostridium sp. 19966]MDT8718115.1 transcription elongation factor GreA [Clostridium sp. 19966]
MHNYLTEEVINKLQEEIEHRKVVVRRRINDDLKEARAQGDLSENYEYKAAKRDRAQNEGRIRYLERMIRTAKVVNDDTSEDEVGIGKTVAVSFINDEEEENFFIVTTVEADPLNNKISIESPIGKAIYRKHIGEIVEVEAPEEKYKIKIENIFRTDAEEE